MTWPASCHSRVPSVGLDVPVFGCSWFSPVSCLSVLAAGLYGKLVVPSILKAWEISVFDLSGYNVDSMAYLENWLNASELVDVL